MDVGLLLRLGGVLALVAANGFFVAAEFALVSARRTRIDELAAAGDRLARVVQRVQDNLDHAISGTQLGITLASLGLGWIGEPALAATIEGLFAGIGIELPPVTLHTVAVIIAFLIITFLHIVLGELAPKTVALLKPEQVSRHLAGPLLLFNKVMGPSIWILNGAAQLFLRMVGVRATDTHGAEHAHSPEEIERVVRHSLRQGMVEEDEQAMIEGVFELTHTSAREVMTPRPDIASVTADDTAREILAVAAESGYSRFPVTGESLDDIVGVVVAKDLITEIVRDPDSTQVARDLMRDAFFVPATKAIDDLIAELRVQKTHLAIVVDEFGGTDGIVTLEDLLEEIVGEIYDEHDVEEADIEVGDDGTVVLDGGLSFSDLLEALGSEDIDVAEDYDTVAGYVIGALGRIPEPGDRVQLGEAELEVAELVERRITRLTLHGASEEGVVALRQVSES